MLPKIVEVYELEMDLSDEMRFVANTTLNYSLRMR